MTVAGPRGTGSVLLPPASLYVGDDAIFTGQVDSFLTTAPMPGGVVIDRITIWVRGLLTSDPMIGFALAARAVTDGESFDHLRRVAAPGRNANQNWAGWVVRSRVDFTNSPHVFRPRLFVAEAGMRVVLRLFPNTTGTLRILVEVVLAWPGQYLVAEIFGEDDDDTRGV